MKKSILQVFITSILVTIIQSSCAPASAPPTTRLTPTPMDTVTPTHSPTSTPTPPSFPTENVEAPEEDSTSSAQAMAQSFEVITAELDRVGYSMEEGELGWLQPQPLEMTANQQNSPLADIREAEPLVFANFILSIDIDWGQFSDGNVGGCGIAFRAQDDFQEAIFFTTQHQPLFNSWNLEHWKDGDTSGLLGSGVYEDGKYEEVITSGKNHYLLVVDGLAATVYANGKQIETVKLPTGLSEGQIAVFPLALIGSSTCTFMNGWIWKLPYP